VAVVMHCNLKPPPPPSDVEPRPTSRSPL